MKLSLILFFIAGVAATEDRAAPLKGSAATEQAGSLRRALKKGNGNGPPDGRGEQGPPPHSCEARNALANTFPACSEFGGLGDDDLDTCEACCECECEGGAFTGNAKCVPEGDCDGPVITTGDCSTACGCT